VFSPETWVAQSKGMGDTCRWDWRSRW
jgi:hypothetical protein